MTEAEWLAASDPTPMVELIWGKGSNRKLRLFSIACFRSVWNALTPGERETVRMAERVADGEVSYGELRLTTVKRRVLRSLTGVTFDPLDSGQRNKWLVQATPAECISRQPIEDREVLGNPHHRYTHLLRDIFGKPFCPITPNPSWLTSTVVAIAEGIYADRAFDRLPILADALQDAGCDNADVLNHGRGGGVHVRGCWVVDLVLGKG
jgi:hypothetical protein